MPSITLGPSAQSTTLSGVWASVSATHGAAACTAGSGVPTCRTLLVLLGSLVQVHRASYCLVRPPVLLTHILSLRLLFSIAVIRTRAVRPSNARQQCLHVEQFQPSF